MSVLANDRPGAPDAGEALLAPAEPRASRAARRTRAGWMLAALLAPGSLGWGLAIDEAQAFGPLRGATRQLARPVLHSVRTVIRPTLRIVAGRAGAVAEVHAGRSRDRLLVILADGSARLWDFERGEVTAGPERGRGIVSGALRENADDGRAEAIAVGRDGAVLAAGAHGTVRRLGGPVAGIDPRIAPVVSSDGSILAFRAREGGWRWMRVAAGETAPLPRAARESRPVVSADGSAIAWRTVRGTWAARRLAGAEPHGEAMEAGGCTDRGVRITAGALTADGERLILGDERGNLCGFDLTTRGGLEGTLERRFVQRAAHPEAIRRLAIGGRGRRVAAGGDGPAVSVRPIVANAGEPVVLELDAAPHALALDAQRGRLFAGADDGTIGWYSLESGALVARLVSTAVGWAVVDRKGRFDGSRNALEALVWAGRDATQTLPVDAFSESWFEPGLLTRLASRSPVFLNDDVRDLAEDGYHPPPAVTIEPVDARDVDARGRLPVRVRVERGYPWDVLGVRLHHNGKQVLPRRSAPARAGGAVEYRVPLAPGENVFTAVGIGPGGVESRPATATITLAGPGPREPALQVVAVGIDEYGPPEWRLDYSRNDAQAIAETLVRRAGGAFGEVSAVTLLEASASLDAIERHVLRAPASPEDVLVVYLAGHGYALPGEDGWEWYFLPFSAGWNDMGIEVDERVRRHGLSSRRLMRFLVETQPRRVFLILDSCRSGTVIETIAGSGDTAFTDSVGRKTLSRLARVGGVHVLAAARANEDAWELVSQPHGALTYLVLEGVRGAADANLDRAISVREIVDYAIREMPLLSARLVREEIIQQPVGYSRGADFTVAGL